jgi:beta-glucanase (GH16 family)
MKKINIFIISLISLAVNGQFNYQSTIRNSVGQLVVNQMISLRFSIKTGSTSGNVVYSEIQHPITNGQGNISVAIGNGSPIVGQFLQINWSSGFHYLTVEFFTGTNTCQWVDVSPPSNSQMVSFCNGQYIYGVCSNFTNLVWSDEFTGTGAINSNNWFQQTQFISGTSWANNEQQHYTNRQDNAYVSNGTLKIVAKKENYTDQGVTKQYTSARLNSKFAFTYGRVEVRAKLPSGAGTWPAIWMLGKNIIENGAYWSNTNGTVSWPACGEVDIMEHWGNNQNYVQSALHTPSSYGSTVNLGGQTIPTASTDFHVYTLEWTADKMEFSVDGITHYTYHPAVKDASNWPFNAPQYLLLNLAMQPYIDPNFTQSALEVDYVRVYQ